MDKLTIEQLAERADRGIALWQKMGKTFTNNFYDEDYLKIAVMALIQDVYQEGYQVHEDACQQLCMFCGKTDVVLSPLCRYVSCDECYNHYIRNGAKSDFTFTCHYCDNLADGGSYTCGDGGIRPTCSKCRDRMFPDFNTELKCKSY